MIKRMIKLVTIILLLRQIDGLCFKKRAGIKPKLFGTISYHNKAKDSGDSLGEEFYSVPILFKSRQEPLKIAIHEVRHRVQWNRPEMCLLTLEDVPASMRPRIRIEAIRKMSPREVDAQIFAEIFLPLFSSKKLSSFPKLMLRESHHPMGS